MKPYSDLAVRLKDMGLTGCELLDVMNAMMTNNDLILVAIPRKSNPRHCDYWLTTGGTPLADVRLWAK